MVNKRTIERDNNYIYKKDFVMKSCKLKTSCSHSPCGILWNTKYSDFNDVDIGLVKVTMTLSNERVI